MSINKASVKKQHDMIGIRENKNTGRTRHPDARWFGLAGLGLFLHWGISSVRGEGDISWSMIYPVPGTMRQMLDQIGPQAIGRVFTPEEYWAQAREFNPDRYDPNKWLSAARRAGFTYAVLTTRHHDGYAMWPSAFGSFGTRTHMNGRDLLKPYVEACRANGIKVGFYYSPPDWYYNRKRISFRYGGKQKFPDLPDLGTRHAPVTLPTENADQKKKWEEEYHAYIKGQVEELLTNYGKIDVLWFDGGPAAISVERIRELQPGILINPRAHGQGDYITPEGVFPKERPDGWWELCHVWNEGGWGYRSHEIFKPTGWVTMELARVRSWGGNFLLNMGPDAHGELPAVAYQRFEELTRWMKPHGKSLFQTEPGPWPEQCNVPVTIKGNVWYLHISWIWEEPVVLKNVKKPKGLFLMRTGEPVAFEHAGKKLKFLIPLNRLSGMGDVVRIDW